MLIGNYKSSNEQIRDIISDENTFNYLYKAIGSITLYFDKLIQDDTEYTIQQLFGGTGSLNEYEGQYTENIKNFIINSFEKYDFIKFLNYVPECVRSIKLDSVKANMGSCTFEYFISITCDRPLSQLELIYLQDAIDGQMSDGFGENLEQQSITDNVYIQADAQIVLEEGSCKEIVIDNVHQVKQYVHLWNTESEIVEAETLI